MVSDGPDIFGPKADDFIFSLSIYIKLVITKKRIKTSTDRQEKTPRMKLTLKSTTTMGVDRGGGLQCLSMV